MIDNPRPAAIRLRGVESRDLELLQSMRGDAGLQASLLTTVDNADEAATRDWLVRREQEPSGAFRIVAEGGEGVAVGYVQVANVHRRNRTGYGGIVLGADARGRGVGSSALLQLQGVAAKELGLRKLMAEIRSDNAASVRLHACVGYRTVGVLHRHFVDAAGAEHDVLLMERGLIERGVGDRLG